jgi:energy-coupling factor transport system permease protein
MARSEVGVKALNPVTWWLLGLSLAILAGLSQWISVLASLASAALLGIVLFSPPQVRRSSLRLYGGTAVAVLVVRVGFRIVFNSPAVSEIALVLPELHFHFLGMNFYLLGAVSRISLLAGLTDGLRLTAIVLAVGLAASVANPRKLIRSAPTVLYEFATATTIAINVAPQLVTSLNRVRRARTLRGGSAGLGNLKGLIIPVLEDTIQRSLDLAASMDSRGFGRRGAMRLRVVYSARAAGGIGVMLLGISSYLILAVNNSAPMGLGLLLLGLASIAVSARLAGMYRVRTRLILAKASLADWAIRLLCLLLILLAGVANLDPGLNLLGWRL